MPPPLPIPMRQHSRRTPPSRLRRRVILPAVLVLLAAVPGHQGRFETLARASLSQLDGEARLDGLRARVDVVRDRWGVPHITARNTDDLFFAQGFVQAQDRLWQMEMYRRTWEGTLSEVLGPDYLSHDRLARLLRYRGPWDEREFARYHPEGRRILEAFARGVNAYIAQAGERLPVEFRLTGIRPQPWTPEVALLRTQTAMPVADALNELRLARRVAAVGVDSANREARPSPWRDLVVPDGFDPSVVDDAAIAALNALRTGVVRPALLPEYASLAGAVPSENTGVQEHSPGSNNWAISGRLTASGKPIMANDPHRNVGNPSIRYIVHLTAPGWDVIGATEAPLPGVMIGHNGRIAWGLTIVGTDQSDVVVEQVNPADRRQVRWRGAWEPMRVVIDTIRVKGAEPVVVEHRFTRHGPVFHEDTVRHLAYAMRSTAHEPGSAGYLSALRYHAIDDCRRFLDAQRYYQAPTENMVCADVHGNIAWQASALSPRRPNWHGRLPVPGHDGRYEWDGFRDDLPLFRGWRSGDAAVERGRALLDAWDAQHRRESAAAALWRFVGRAIPGEARATGVSAAQRQALLEGALRTGLDSLRAVQGDDPAQWRWGRFNTSQLPHAFVKAYDIAPVERHGGAGFVAAVGATYRQVVDLGDLDASVATNAPGQSGQPGSPFYASLVEGYGRGEYFPLSWSRAAVERAAAHRLALLPR